MQPKIGFIGQGWIGKHYADEFESRKYSVVRYSLEEPYFNNRSLIPDCDIVFIAVPTPTTPEGFDYSKVEESLGLIGKGKTAVIKSTLLPGTTVALQEKFPGIYVFHSPEFLVEKTAAYDAAHPNRNIIGIPKDTADTRQKAVEVLRVLPEAPYNKIMLAKDAELIKYAGNCFLYTKVMFMNVLFDAVQASGGDWTMVREGLINDPRVGVTHTEPVHSSGRGAGGHCFIKDFEAFRHLYSEATHDPEGTEFLKAMAAFNVKLLRDSQKDIELLQGVYGNDLQVR
jgi:UDPglucose 6-dehydrogenase